MTEHYRKAAWFLENRGVTRYKLNLCVARGEVRTRKAGEAKASPRLYCVEDWDDTVAEERALASRRRKRGAA